MPCLFVNQLTVIDCSYLHEQRGLLGETWVVDLELEGALDDAGMIIDFGPLKKQVKQLIDQTVDHKLLVPLKSDRLKLQQDESCELVFQSDAAVIHHRSPPQALALINADSVNTDSLREHLSQALASIMPTNVQQLRLHLYHEHIEGAYYHYSHGLKKHDGDCQRIAHGHRSRIEIEIDGKRDHAAEQDWASRWRDIYLATEEDLCDNGGNDERFRFAYKARQGDFEIELPAARCHLMSTDTTVELIAQHIAETLANEKPGQAIIVRAYEGLNKGAVANSMK